MSSHGCACLCLLISRSWTGSTMPAIYIVFLGVQNQAFTFSRQTFFQLNTVPGLYIVSNIPNILITASKARTYGGPIIWWYIHTMGDNELNINPKKVTCFAVVHFLAKTSHMGQSYFMLAKKHLEHKNSPVYVRVASLLSKVFSPTHWCYLTHDNADWRQRSEQCLYNA